MIGECHRENLNNKGIYESCVELQYLTMFSSIKREVKAYSAYRSLHAGTLSCAVNSTKDILEILTITHLYKYHNNL